MPHKTHIIGFCDEGKNPITSKSQLKQDRDFRKTSRTCLIAKLVELLNTLGVWFIPSVDLCSVFETSRVDTRNLLVVDEKFQVCVNSKFSCAVARLSFFKLWLRGCSGRDLHTVYKSWHNWICVCKHAVKGGAFFPTLDGNVVGRSLSSTWFRLVNNKADW